MTRARNRFYLFGTVFVAFVAAGCGEKELEARSVVRPVKLFEFGAASAHLQFHYPGRVFANRTVDVGFEVTGKLADLPVVRGQEVRAGDLLARLDQRDFANGLKSAQATLAEATATYERFKSAAQTGAVARQQLDEAQASMTRAEADLRIKQKALDDTEIRADFDGIVANRFVENFDNIVAKQPIVSLQDIAQLEIRINIPESDMARAGSEVGKMTATFAAVPGREFEQAIKEFATEADPVTQTFLITLLMPNPDDAEILPGMTASVTWEPPAKEVGSQVTVPAVAVGGSPGGGAWVWIVRDDQTVARRQIVVGQIVDGDMVEVTSGLQPGEVVAAAGIYHLQEGMKVRKFGS